MQKILKLLGTKHALSLQNGQRNGLHHERIHTRVADSITRTDSHLHLSRSLDLKQVGALLLVLYACTWRTLGSPRINICVISTDVYLAPLMYISAMRVSIRINFEYELNKFQSSSYKFYKLRKVYQRYIGGV